MVSAAAGKIRLKKIGKRDVVIRTPKGELIVKDRPGRRTDEYLIITPKFKIGGFDCEGRLKHVECQKCKQEWRMKKGASVDEVFEIKMDEDKWYIRCKKCYTSETLIRVVKLFPE